MNGSRPRSELQGAPDCTDLSELIDSDNVTLSVVEKITYPIQN